MMLLYIETVFALYILIGGALYRFRYKKIFDELMKNAESGTQFVTIFFAVMAWPKLLRSTINDYRKRPK